MGSRRTLGLCEEVRVHEEVSEQICEAGYKLYGEFLWDCKLRKDHVRD